MITTLFLLALVFRPGTALHIRRALPTSASCRTAPERPPAAETNKPIHPATLRLAMTTNDSTSSPYYLLWSPGMLPKFALSALALGVLHFLPRFAGSVVFPKELLLSPHVQWLQQLILPLLASACCMIQLLLNALSIGCAGFNKILGPIRPFLVSLLLFLSPHSAPKDLLWRWSMALLPEILHGWNQLVRRPKRNTHDNNNNATVTLKVHIPTMGCVACIHAIQTAVSKIPDVESVNASLSQHGGEAVIVLSNQADSRLIIKTIEDAGFPSPEIVSMP